MTVTDFCAAIYVIGVKYDGSVTSWGRTNARATQVGGFAGDPHTWWRGADMVYDTGPNRPGSESHLRSPRSCPDCSEKGLKVIHEKSHDHYQPMDMPAGPVTDYKE